MIQRIGELGQIMQRPPKFGLFGAICALALMSLTGCGSLPASGPSTSDITGQEVGKDDQPQYMLVDITPRTIETLRRRGFGSFYAQFGDRRISTEPVIEVGNSVTVTVWEAAAGGLFSPATTTPTGASGVGAGSNSATIPEQVVGRDGGITVPYAGRIHVVGRTTRAVQDQIEHALEGKAIQPQVLVNITRTAGDAVSVGGEVANGARVPLSVKGDRLLDVLAVAGGVRAPVNETFVELSRGSKTSRIPLINIVNNPSENIYMHPGDTLTLVRDPQTFIALGAMGQNAEIPFQADGISLAQALAKSGGLRDERSDPRGVFVFRYEPEFGRPSARADEPACAVGAADAGHLSARSRQPQRHVSRAELPCRQSRRDLRVELALDGSAEGVRHHQRRDRDRRVHREHGVGRRFGRPLGGGATAGPAASGFLAMEM